MHKIPSIMEMLKAGAHFGHRSGRWHPKMAKYIFGVRNGIHVLDLEKTAEEIQKTLEYVKNLVAKGKNILFIGTKRQARELVIEAAKSCDMPYINERWIGGLLTNFEEMKRRLRKYNTLKAEVASGEIEKYTKKEQVDFKKLLAKMDRYLIGLAKLEKLPDALYIADLRTEKTAVTEANKTNVPIVAVCDTNVNRKKPSTLFRPMTML
ncbi:30S ribosomal protein S2 [Patescibacteria group bacterium]|nr:30S ribosomal protein S2 [Patescibacteria group bacterium]